MSDMKLRKLFFEIGTRLISERQNFILADNEMFTMNFHSEDKIDDIHNGTSL